MSERQAGDCGAAVAAPPARILLVDDHPLIRHAVREMLEPEPDMAICGEAGDAEEARRLFRDTQPQLVLLDLSLGDSDGMELIQWMLKTTPGARVLVLSMHDEALYAQRVIHAGAHGYVNKRESPDTIVAAIRTVLAGRIHLNPALMDRIVQRLAYDGFVAKAPGRTLTQT
jgi:DNA-binding NarL/FixJ family response regulator